MITALIISIALNIVFVGVIIALSYFAFCDPDRAEEKKIKEGLLATAEAQKQRATDIKERNEKVNTGRDTVHGILNRD